MLLAWLFILIDRGFFKAIHKSTPVLYVMDFLKYHDSEAGEVVRVAKALPQLPRLAETFEKGEISWSQVKLISSVAKEADEEEWLEFQRTHRAGALRAEVIYQTCPTCHGSHVLTKDGLVEVEHESVKKIEDEAQKVVIEPHDLLKGDLLKDEIEEFAAVAPAVVVVKVGQKESNGTNGPRPTPPAPSAPPAVPAPALDPALERECELVAKALMKIGHQKGDARDLVREAMKRLGSLGRTPTGNEIMCAAVRLGAGSIKSYGSRICGNQREPKDLPPPKPA